MCTIKTSRDRLGMYISGEIERVVNAFNPANPKRLSILPHIKRPTKPWLIMTFDFVLISLA